MWNPNNPIPDEFRDVLQDFSESDTDGDEGEIIEEEESEDEQDLDVEVRFFVYFFVSSLLHKTYEINIYMKSICIRVFIFY